MRYGSRAKRHGALQHLSPGSASLHAVLVGEVGAGKSTVLRSTLAACTPARFPWLGNRQGCHDIGGTGTKSFPVAPPSVPATQRGAAPPTPRAPRPATAPPASPPPGSAAAANASACSPVGPVDPPLHRLPRPALGTSAPRVLPPTPGPAPISNLCYGCRRRPPRSPSACTGPPRYSWIARSREADGYRPNGTRQSGSTVSRTPHSRQA